MTGGKKLAGAKKEAEAIRSDEELDEATEELCALMTSKKPLSESDVTRMEHLVNIIEEYEDANYAIPEPCHGALLQHLLDVKGGGVRGLAKATGLSTADIKAILGGERQVRLPEANAVADYFSVEPSVFDPEPDTFAVVESTVVPETVGIDTGGLFSATTYQTATWADTKKDSPTFMSAFLPVLRQVGSVEPPHFGLQSSAASA